MTSILELMVKVKMLDKAELTPRDLLVMWVVHNNPGIQGMDLTNKLGLASRSAIQGHLFRLIREGYLEDRRVKAGKTIPNILHLLPKGEKFYQDFIA